MDELSPPLNRLSSSSGGFLFHRELRIGFEADTTGTLSTGLDAQASDRTAPALRTDFLLKATFLGVLIWTSLLQKLILNIIISLSFISSIQAILLSLCERRCRR